MAPATRRPRRGRLAGAFVDRWQRLAAAGAVLLSAPGAAAASSFLRTQLRNATSVAADTRLPFSPNAGASVGKVFALYYSEYSGAKATSVESSGAPNAWRPAQRLAGDVWHGSTRLPTPRCPLQLTSQTDYPSAARKANLRLAELAICELLDNSGHTVPSCAGSAGDKGDKGDDVCELEMMVPAPSSDELQEPHIGAAMALAAYSKLCSLGKKSKYATDVCSVHRAGSVVCAGLALSGQTSMDGGAGVRLAELPSSGLLDIKLEDAYLLRFDRVFLAQSAAQQVAATEFEQKRHDVLHWQHAPPSLELCSDLSCLADRFMAVGAWEHQ
eukprot:TRINITY_DN4013_c0_g1_i2.p2 TRINITY_DN4013_c0_g1~~TRINITY_DN4013_c0_g1_i2.p2  ORF type:complete len:328 (+),score=70.93 TRINITY_DN4013_c0_g1_i2:99-1082(+)